MRHLISRLRRPDGTAIPVVIGSLAVASLLAMALFQVGLTSSKDAIQDRDAKRALAAATAGLEMGFLKLTEVRPDANQCVAAEATNDCNSFLDPAVSMGNGATYKYIVGRPADRADCPRIPNIAETANDRCITAVGEAGGVTRRVQSRVVFVPPVKPFRFTGLVANELLELSNEPTLTSAVGTNGTLRTRNPIVVDGNVFFGPNPADWDSSHTVTITAPHTTTRLAEKIPFPEIGPIFDAGWLERTTSNGLPPGANTTSRALSIASGVYTLPAGTWFVCSFTVASGAQVLIPAGTARVFIDAGANCPGTSPDKGKFRVSNGGTLVNWDSPLSPPYTQNAAKLELYLRGTASNGRGLDATIGNESFFAGTIYAPRSRVEIGNEPSLVGGVAANEISMSQGGGFLWPSNIQDKDLPGTGTADRRGFFHCPATPTVGGDPESGCK